MGWDKSIYFMFYFLIIDFFLNDSRRKLIIYFIYSSLFLLLSSCSPSTSPIVTLTKNIVRPNKKIFLNPNYHYLRVSYISHNILPTPTVYLALRSSETTSNGLLQVWYSADREVIKFCHDRLCGSAGLNVDWRDVVFKNVPSWEQIQLQDRSYERQRFVMPGYRFGIQDRIVVSKIPVPKNSLLVDYDPHQFLWFQEKTFCSQKEMRIPPARYAVDFSGNKPKVIYSEQCLAKGFCFAFQSWDVQQKRTFNSSSNP